MAGIRQCIRKPTNAYSGRMPASPSFASSFRSEVSRLARKEARAVVGPALKDLSAAKQTIREQKRSIAQLERTVAHLSSLLTAQAKASGDTTVAQKAKRAEKWRKDSVRSTRRRLRLTQAEFAELVGVSLGSVNGWETGRTEPREALKREVLELRSLSPAEARERLG